MPARAAEGAVHLRVLRAALRGRVRLQREPGVHLVGLLVGVPDRPRHAEAPDRVPADLCRHVGRRLRAARRRRGLLRQGRERGAEPCSKKWA